MSEMFKAFVAGMLEWESDLTLSFDAPRHVRAYDLGRAYARRVMRADER